FTSRVDGVGRVARRQPARGAGVQPDGPISVVVVEPATVVVVVVPSGAIKTTSLPSPPTYVTASVDGPTASSFPSGALAKAPVTAAVPVLSMSVIGGVGVAAVVSSRSPASSTAPPTVIRS